MKRVLQIIFSIILAVAFVNATDKPIDTNAGSTIANQGEETTAYYTESSSFDTCLGLSRHTFSTNTHRVQVTTKRSNSTHKSNFIFIKTGKTTNTGFRYFINKETLTNLPTACNHTHRLITLGRLII